MKTGNLKLIDEILVCSDILDECYVMYSQKSQCLQLTTLLRAQLDEKGKDAKNYLLNKKNKVHGVKSSALEFNIETKGAVTSIKQTQDTSFIVVGF